MQSPTGAVSTGQFPSSTHAIHVFNEHNPSNEDNPEKQRKEENNDHEIRSKIA